MIPRANIIDVSLARGVTDAFDTVQVKHKSGGISVVKFKSYEQGRAKFQGATLDFIWLDEEPPLDVYSECLTRVTATKGFVYMTFTPLLGMSEVVMRYLNEPSEERGVVTMTIDDAKHIPPEERAKIIAGYPAHERDARAKGIPMLGSGRIFQYADLAVSEEMIQNIPTHWCKLWAVDFGIDHPFAAVLLLWDRDNDVIHIHHCIRIRDAMPINHAAAMKPIGAAVPVTWPQDGHQREKGSGETLSKIYKSHGLKMLEHHATFPDGGNSTEAGIMQMDERFKNGKLKVASHLSDWFEEFRLYHRKDGQIVKLRDDLMSATRVGVMNIRAARLGALGPEVRKRSDNGGFARDIDFKLF
jgi:phage terminase large subunit-like protein